MQGLAEQLYADFLKRLAAATASTVVSLSPTSRRPPAMPKVESGQAGQALRQESHSTIPREYIFATPRDLPLAFMHIDTQSGQRGRLSTRTTTKAFAEARRATLEAHWSSMPTVIVDFAQLESSGNSRFATSAEASATPEGGVSAAGTMLDRHDRARTPRSASVHADARFSRLNHALLRRGRVRRRQVGRFLRQRRPGQQPDRH
jgi:hypothetical protein